MRARSRAATGAGTGEVEIALLMRDYPFDEVMATRLFHAAVSYLITAMETPQAVNSSSRIAVWGLGVEHRWRVAWGCARVFGRARVRLTRS